MRSRPTIRKVDPDILDCVLIIETMKPVRFLLCVVLSALSVACRKDEPMHLPQVPADIVSMELEGQTELSVDKDLNRVDAVMQEGFGR